MIVSYDKSSYSKKRETILTEESCLSLEGFRQTTRYETIEVKFLDANFKEKNTSI